MPDRELERVVWAVFVNGATSAEIGQLLLGLILGVGLPSPLAVQQE